MGRSILCFHGQVQAVFMGAVFSDFIARIRMAHNTGDRVCGAQSESDLWNELAQDFARTMKTLWR
jgi:hypothetical protein